MKKFLALLMALAMVFTFAACGGNDDVEETTTTPEAVENDTTEAVDAPVEESSAAVEESSAAEETSAVEESSAAVEESSAAGEEESSEAVAAEMSKAEFVAFLNAETAKIAKSGKYALNRKCEYTDPIDVGGATDILNGIIGAIDEGSNLDTVVGDFLGIGTTKANVPADKVDSDYKIMASTLNESDVSSFAVSNGVYTFTLANATDPKKTAATPFARFTNDFITHEEVVDGIAEFTTAIKVNSTTVNYKNIKVEVTVAEGKITNIKYSYAFDAQLALKAVVTINGSGAAVTNTTYSNIKY